MHSMWELWDVFGLWVLVGIGIILIGLSPRYRKIFLLAVACTLLIGMITSPSVVKQGVGSLVRSLLGDMLVTYGSGELSFPNGSYYDGELRNGVPHGYGVMFYPSGYIIEGEWRDGEPLITEAILPRCGGFQDCYLRAAANCSKLDSFLLFPEYFLYQSPERFQFSCKSISGDKAFIYRLGNTINPIDEELLMDFRARQGYQDFNLRDSPEYDHKYYGFDDPGEFAYVKTQLLEFLFLKQNSNEEKIEKAMNKQDQEKQ